MKLENEHKILVVDDAKDTQMLLDFDLSAAGYKVTSCDSGEDALAILETQEIDLILLDMYMPGLSGLETLVKVKAKDLTADTPVIMLSASTDEDEVVAALELGAGDYVIKPYVAKVLLARIRTAIRLQEKTTQLEYLAKTDFLTGINNRGCFFELSSNAIGLAHRTGQPFVVAMFDIDFFKPINDNYGHDVGDEVLRVFSKGLTEIFRGYDIIGRIGGEEFAVCLPNTSMENANIACERFRTHVENLTVGIKTDDNTQEDIHITVSIGLVLATKDVVSIDELLKQADCALYYAKEHGRNQVVNADLINLTSDTTTVVNEATIMVNQNITSQNNSSLNNVHVGNENLLEDSLMLPSFDGIEFDVGLSNVLGDEELFKEILVMFYQDHHLDGEKLHNAIQSKDIQTTKHLAHTLKGVACSVGAMELFEVTKELDVAANENNFSDIETLYLAVSPELNRVMKGIKVELDVE